MRRNITFLSVLIVLLIMGCSGGRHENPLTPDKAIIDYNPIIDLTSYGDGFNATGIFGTFELTINPDEMTADLVPKRVASIGEDYIVSGISFFTKTPCSNCLNLVGFGMGTEGKVTLLFQVTHPFAPGDPSKPPSGSNRLDLDVFDLALVVKPVDSPATSFPLTGVNVRIGTYADADGYTFELKSFAGDYVLPYWLVIDDNEALTNTNNRFAMGDSAIFETTFYPAAGSLTFDLYLTMAYGASAKKAIRLTPKYYNPEFNRKAAWKVAVIPPEGTNTPARGNTWQEFDSTVKYDVTVKVWDWQSGATVWNGVTPPKFSDTYPDNVFKSSEVLNVSAEIPGMTHSLPVTNTPVSGTGKPNNPLIYKVSFANENLLPRGIYDGLVKVTDNRKPAVNWATEGRDFLIDSPNGSALIYYNIPEYATYQWFQATIVRGCGPITGQINNPDCPITGIGDENYVDFNVSATSGHGGAPVVLYECDYNYDGVTFHTDDSNVDGVFNDVGPFSVADPCDNNIPKDFIVAFRATDRCNPPNVTIFATCEVTVDSCLHSVGNVTLVVNRQTGTAYGDPFSTSNPWTLNWATVPLAQQYAIYRDNNPVDGLTNNLVFIGSTTSPPYNVPSSELPGNHYVPGNTYIVRARSIINDPGSESTDSQPAHIIAGSWETATLDSIINNSEGWNARWEQAGDSSDFSRFPCILYTPAAYGSRGAKVSSQYLGSSGSGYPGHWNAIVHQTPILPHATVRFLDFSVYLMGIMDPVFGGIAIGTCSTSGQGGGWSTPGDLEWANSAYTAPFTGYQSTSMFVGDTWDDAPTSYFNCWAYPDVRQKYRFGGDVNIDGDPSDSYVAICGAKSMFSGGTPFINMDEWAICIY